MRYSFTLANTSSRLLRQAEFWTYAPVRQTATPVDTTRNAYTWVAENIRYAGYLPDDRGAPLGNAHRFAHAGEGLKVRMN